MQDTPARCESKSHTPMMGVILGQALAALPLLVPGYAHP
jgi:hypothetical protein